MADEPENLTLRLLREMRERMATKDDLEAFRDKGRGTRFTKADLNSLRADVASDMVLMRKELSEQIVGLRRAVVEYHSTTVGHGILDQRIGGAGAPSGAAFEPAAAGDALSLRKWRHARSQDSPHSAASRNPPDCRRHSAA